MKKTLLTLAAIIGISLAAYQSAEAKGWGGGMGMDCGMMDGSIMGQGKLSEKDLKVREKFSADTSELRKKMVTKRAELEAVMAGANPDEKKTAALSGDLFDLREQMQQKAKEAGIVAGSGAGCGMAAMGGGARYGKGAGYGRGAGPQQQSAKN